MEKPNSFSKKILIGITGSSKKQLLKKIKDTNKLNIKKAALFLEFINKKQRQNIYQALSTSNIKIIPLVHSRHDMEIKEYKYLIKKYKTKYFTIHEDAFGQLNKLKGLYKYLCLEMNYDNKLSKTVNVNKVGGFCIDLSHFMAEMQRKTKEYEYIKRKEGQNIFTCNHLNGYTYKGKKDLHKIRNFNDFNYIKKLPKFVFGTVIALEINNSISEQLKYKCYLEKMLNKKFSGN